MKVEAVVDRTKRAWWVKVNRFTLGVRAGRGDTYPQFGYKYLDLGQWTFVYRSFRAGKGLTKRDGKANA